VASGATGLCGGRLWLKRCDFLCSNYCISPAQTSRRVRALPGGEEAQRRSGSSPSPLCACRLCSSCVRDNVGVLVTSRLLWTSRQLVIVRSMAARGTPEAVPHTAPPPLDSHPHLAAALDAMQRWGRWWTAAMRRMPCNKQPGGTEAGHGPGIGAYGHWRPIFQTRLCK